MPGEPGTTKGAGSRGGFPVEIRRRVLAAPAPPPRRRLRSWSVRLPGGTGSAARGRLVGLRASAAQPRRWPERAPVGRPGEGGLGRAEGGGDLGPSEVAAPEDPDRGPSRARGWVGLGRGAGSRREAGWWPWRRRGPLRGSLASGVTSTRT